MEDRIQFEYSTQFSFENEEKKEIENIITTLFSNTVKELTELCEIVWRSPERSGINPFLISYPKTRIIYQTKIEEDKVYCRATFNQEHDRYDIKMAFFSYPSMAPIAEMGGAITCMTKEGSSTVLLDEAFRKYIKQKK